MLKRRCLLTLPHNKKLVLIVLLLGALLTAGLFLFKAQRPRPLEVSELKPSQLNLSQSNSLPTTSTNAQVEAVEKPELILPKAQQLQNEDKSKWDVFDNIVKTKNDNDPRLDHELKNLSPALREALFEKYDSLPQEDRSARGLIAYLIARELKTPEDAQFLKQVYQEAPCLSLADCKTSAPDDPHHSSTNQTTLVYPQLSLLYVIEKQLTENPQYLNDASKRSEYIQLLVAAESYPVPVVNEKARGIRNKFGL